MSLKSEMRIELRDELNELKTNRIESSLVIIVERLNHPILTSTPGYLESDSI